MCSTMNECYLSVLVLANYIKNDQVGFSHIPLGTGSTVEPVPRHIMFVPLWHTLRAGMREKEIEREIRFRNRFYTLYITVGAA